MCVINDPPLSRDAHVTKIELITCKTTEQMYEVTVLVTVIFSLLALTQRSDESVTANKETDCADKMAQGHTGWWNMNLLPVTFGDCNSCNKNTIIAHTCIYDHRKRKMTLRFVI